MTAHVAPDDRSMADFDDHLRYGVVAHALLISVAFLTVLLVHRADALLIAYLSATLPVALLGAIIPDIDHPSSKAYTLLKQMLPRGVASGVGVILLVHHERLVQALVHPVLSVSPGFLAGIIWSCIVVGAWYGTERLLPRLRPTHRGPTHRLPVGALLTILVAGTIVTFASGLQLTAPLLAGTSGGTAFLVGYVSHLYADGLLFERETFLSIE